MRNNPTNGRYLIENPFIQDSLPLGSYNILLQATQKFQLSLTLSTGLLLLLYNSTYMQWIRPAQADVRAWLFALMQRGLNDLQRTRLSRRHMIWLLPHPLPSPVSKLDRRHTGRLRKRDNLLTEEGGRRRESLVFYKSFNTLCSNAQTAYILLKVFPSCILYIAKSILHHKFMQRRGPHSCMFKFGKSFPDAEATKKRIRGQVVDCMCPISR